MITIVSVVKEHLRAMLTVTIIKTLKIPYDTK